MQLKDDVPSRSVHEVGTGDYIKVGSQWKRVESNSAQGEPHAPRSWTVRTEDGGSYGGMQINRYAKAEDLTE